MNPRGKTALITGASSGIGAATARALAHEGARVLLLARRATELEKVASSIGAGVATTYPVDLSSASAVAQVAERIASEVGTPDIIVNNAGAGRWKFVDETTPEEAVQMMAVPYFAAFYVTHAFLPRMLRRNTGHIVNISSVGSRFVWPGATAYIAARWAVRGFTEALRADLTDTGIRITLFESGVVRSPYWEHNPGSRERVPKMGKLVPELTPEAAGRAIVRGIEREQKLVVAPFMMKVTYWQHAVFPGVVQWLMTRTGYTRPQA
ncbi:MAG TPA: SDR family oxidoreductase [Gemmatimonadales bacterium]|jgi:short-subunit dehydrogenase